MSEDPLWYRDAIIYEVHVRAFKDSDGDGIGDFKGLTSKLDYLQGLGVTALWLLPFYPSPLKDDGYDIADYMSVHPSYGTLRDFKAFLREAHRQGLKVITELVLNHTSDQHPWFQRARRAPRRSAARDYYVWSQTPNRYREARIIFQDFESSNWAWDPETKEYFWHRFYSHQPDLNWDSPHVRRSMFHVVDFWLEMGVDGVRLDAVPYLYEREGTTCENLPETHRLLKELRAHVDERFPNRMLLAEANQWPEDAISYFGDGDECNMAFHFPLMPRMFMAVRMEDRFPIVDILSQTPPLPDNGQWALFLRNHDELTLEMVTDEDRDYMYKVYAEDPQARLNLGIRRRLAPLLGNNRRMIEIMNGLLFSMPGTPVVYYGDEIGMGDNIYLGDRNGVRTPMQWSPDRNAGFSHTNPQRLYLPVIIDPEYHSEALNVEAQQSNPHSLLWWMKRLIALRKRHQALGRGSLQMLYPENRKILAFLRSHADEQILVVANLSRFAQYVELDLAGFQGRTPVEMFGGTEFPQVGEGPYFLTLAPHAFYWFALQAQRDDAQPVSPSSLPVFDVPGTWHELLGRKSREELAEILPAFLAGRRWFGGKGRRIRGVEITDSVAVGDGHADLPHGYLLLLNVEYSEGASEMYMLPVACTSVRRKGERERLAHAGLAMVHAREGEMILHDATWDPAFCSILLDAVARRRRMGSSGGRLIATTTRAFKPMRGLESEALTPTVMSAEQSNTSIVFGDRLILKLFRRPEQGVNPDLEIGRFLTEEVNFSYIPPVGGSIEYARPKAEPITIGIVHGFEHNEGDAWRYTLDSLSRFLESMLAGSEEAEPPEIPHRTHVLDLAATDPPPFALQNIGSYLGSARVIGERTAQLHQALARGKGENFAPEPFLPFDVRSLYESMRTLTNKVFQVVRTRQKDFPEAIQVLDLEANIVKKFRSLLDLKMTGLRTRVHGDFHLGQVLFTGKDFLIIDFEGEPARPLAERRRKRSPLLDVAGMVRSFHYAAYSPLYAHQQLGVFHRDDPSILEPWLHYWYSWVSATFVRSYLQTAGDADFLPKTRAELEALLDCLLLEKALYELGYEVNNRPEWVKLPIQGILHLLKE